MFQIANNEWEWADNKGKMPPVLVKTIEFVTPTHNVSGYVLPIYPNA